MKKVKVALELDESFVRLLQASVQLKGWLADDCPLQALDPVGVLAVAVLGEARGATEQQIWARIPPAYRPLIDVLQDERRVTEIKKERQDAP